ncbi:Phytoene dehydrogenase-related protein [Evansella caseinilytica]|uniref:Phytoene dehydrogenase-related protein n=1 Tax=Evansella caseinilytica TaxID=1503961 RepID=A0A1H3GGH1_9BACI|nr:FAD-dependent oxidoreductase [Evansella caseinilytica]SDY02381.1 Phytoene dehydrogenase-related protein [Evansella caseinilytica]
MSQHPYDVAIIGGGLTGLAAAALLARSGLNVTVLEKGKKLGGRAGTKEMSGSLFNLGPHAFYRNGIADTVLSEIGISLNGGVPPANGQVYFQQQNYLLPASILSILKTKLLNLKEKKEFAALMLNISKMNPNDFDHLTLQQWANSRIASSKNRALLYTFSRLACYLNAPKLVNAGIVFRQLKASLGGAIYVNGGWQSVIQQLRDRAEQAGAFIMTACTAEEITLSGPVKHVTVTDSTGTRQLAANTIISTIPPQVVLRIVKGIHETPMAKMLAACQPVKAACLDVTLNKLTRPGNHFTLDIDHALYFSNHSKAARLTHNPDEQVIHVMQYLAPGQTAEPAELQTTLENFLEKNQPGWKRHITTQRFLPNLTVSWRLPTVGSEDLLEKTLRDRNDSGFILAGEWTTNKHLLAEAALYTAKKAANNIISAKEAMAGV